MLARLEGELVPGALARKVVSIKIVGEPKRRYNNTLRGMASLPLRMAGSVAAPQPCSEARAV